MESAIPIEQFVLDTIALTGNLDRASLALDTNLYDIGFDSVSRVAVISQTESYYGVEFNSDLLLAAFEAQRIHDFIQLIDPVVRQRAQG